MEIICISYAPKDGLDYIYAKHDQENVPASIQVTPKNIELGISAESLTMACTSKPHIKNSNVQ